MAIIIKNANEIEYLRKSNNLVALALKKVKESAKIGVSLDELDRIADDFICSHGARPAFKGLYGFPKAICLSLNNVIIHGIPSEYKLKSGDILGVDIGVEMNGWYGDAAITFGIGEISSTDTKLINASRDALYYAIDNIKSGMRFSELSAILQDSIISSGFVPLSGFCGHGIGSKPHEEPEIPNFVDKSVLKNIAVIENGMVFCIEPMLCQKSGKPLILADKWSVVSQDGLNGSHYEHAVAIIDNRAVILSQE